LLQNGRGMFGSALYLFLSKDPAILGFVGGGLYPRIFPIIIPQRGSAPNVPAIVYSVNNVQRGVAYCATDRLVRTSVLIDCYAITYAECKELAATVRRTLVDYRGFMGDAMSSPKSGIMVSSANIASELDLQDIEPGLYRVSQSWDFWHQEVS
jgi:hypothetical protein